MEWKDYTNGKEIKEGIYFVTVRRRNEHSTSVDVDVLVHSKGHWYEHNRFDSIDCSNEPLTDNVTVLTYSEGIPHIGMNGP